MSKRRYLVKADIVLNFYFQGEIVTADDHDSKRDRLIALLAAGAIQEVPEGSEPPQLDTRIYAKVFAIKATVEDFARYISSVYTGLGNEDRILPQFYDPALAMYQLPVGRGILHLSAPPPAASKSPMGDYRVGFHGLFSSLPEEDVKVYRRGEPPLSFRIIDLETGYIKVQARCALADVPVVKQYFDELMKRLTVLWPEVSLPYPVPGNSPSPSPAAAVSRRTDFTRVATPERALIDTSIEQRNIEATAIPGDGANPQVGAGGNENPLSAPAAFLAMIGSALWVIRDRSFESYLQALVAAVTVITLIATVFKIPSRYRSLVGLVFTGVFSGLLVWVALATAPDSTPPAIDTVTATATATIVDIAPSAPPTATATLEPAPATPTKAMLSPQPTEPPLY